MLNKLMLAFCIIAWLFIIPYMMFDIKSRLNRCKQLTGEIMEVMEDDLLEMTEEEFCRTYGITHEEYEAIHKYYQEV